MGIPGKQTLGRARKGRVWKQEEAGKEAGKTPSSFKLADTKLTEDNSNQGLDNNKASHCWFSIGAQTNHYLIANLLWWESGVHKSKARDWGSFMTKKTHDLSYPCIASNSGWETNQLP